MMHLQINTSATIPVAGGSLPPFSPYPIAQSPSSEVHGSRNHDISKRQNHSGSNYLSLNSPFSRSHPLSASSSQSSFQASSPVGGMSSNNSNVMVGVRIRPLTEKEVAEQCAISFRTSADDISVQEMDERNEIIKLWVYDKAFGPHHNNSFIFQEMGLPLVDAAIDGYNTVLFMYGQTASGKTYTLFGGEGECGIVDHVMSRVHQRVCSSVDTEFVIKMTFAELYNEEIKDLLATSSQSEQQGMLKIVDDPHLGPLIQNITEAPFTTCAEVKALLEEGERRRHFGVTNMNTHSSRSHVMVRLSIESRKVSRRSFQPLRLSWGTDRPTCISTLNLVDLAGSERSSKSGTSGQSLKEGNFINKSLLTLGTVIANLSEGVGPNQHIPYRNSKLTRLLSTALGGNAKTCMISCISPAASNLMESLSTLRFASRAKKIVNVVHKNDLSNSKVLSAKLAQQAAEIEQLRMLLGSSQHGGGNDKEDADVQQKDQAKKAIRCLRFMVRNSSRILRGLRRYGNHSLISKVVGDLHLAVLERHDTDLESLMAELASIITTNLNSDHILQQRLRDLLERLYNDESGEDSLAMDPNDWPEGAAMDEEGYRRQIEMGLLGFEDFRVKAINRTNKLERMVMDFVAKEQKHRGQMQEMRAYTAALEMDLHLKEKRQLSSESQIMRLNEQLKEALLAAEQSNIQKSDLQVHIAEQQERFSLLEMECKWRDAELEKAKATIELLSRQLQSAQASLRSSEEEFERSRSELLAQMDRLRNNMHEMLIRGGEKAVIVTAQNEELQREADHISHELQLAHQSRLRLEKEASFLRAELETLRDAEKAGRDELQSARDQMTESSHRIKELLLEVARLAAAFSVCEQENKRLLSLQSSEAARTEEDARSSLEEIECSRKQAMENCRDLEDRLHQLELEKASAENEVQRKNEALHKLEVGMLNESSRFEKKIALQLKRNEVLLQDLDNLRAEKKASENELQREIDELRLQVKELRDIINTVNEYLERREEENQDFQPISQPSMERESSKSFDFIESEASEEDGRTPRQSIDWQNEVSKPVVSAQNSTPTTKRRIFHEYIMEAEKRTSDSMSRLIAGAQLLTTALKFTLGDERLLRSSLQQSQASSMEEHQNLLFSLSQRSASDRERALAEINRDLEQALSSSKRSHRSISEAFAELEQRHLLNERERNDTALALLERSAQVEQLVQQVEDCRVFLDRATRERQQLDEQLESLERDRDSKLEEIQSLRSHLRSATEERYDLLNQIGLLEQELGVLQAERDELVKRFILRER